MSNSDLHQRLNRANEITLSVKGRKSGKDIPRQVWFVHEGNVLYLLPNRGSDTQWYKNLLGKSITDRNGVGDVLDRFQFKYGQDFKKYYTNFDVAVKVRL